MTGIAVDVGYAVHFSKENSKKSYFSVFQTLSVLGSSVFSFCLFVFLSLILNKCWILWKQSQYKCLIYWESYTLWTAPTDTGVGSLYGGKMRRVQFLQRKNTIFVEHFVTYSTWILLLTGFELFSTDVTNLILLEKNKTTKTKVGYILPWMNESTIEITRRLYASSFL